MYIHIRAIDNNGNASETVHYNLKNVREIEELTSPVLRIDKTDETNPEYNSVNLSWAVDIQKQNILWSLDYEREEQPLINLNPFNKRYPAQSFIGTPNSYKGEYSVMTPKTTDRLGEVPTPEGGPSEKNMIDYNGKRIPLPNGSNISASFRLKSASPVTINLFSDWSYFNTLKSYNSYYADDYPAGTLRVKVTGDPLTIGGSLTTDPVGNVHELNNQIINENYDGSYELFRPLNYPVKKGDPVKYREHGYAFTLPETTTHSSEYWELYNINGEVSNPEDFDWSKNPVNLKQYWSTSENAYMDDLKVGYTTKVKLYRNEELIYEGYNGRYQDLALDEEKPNQVHDMTYSATRENNNIRYSIIPKATDNGTFYRYKAIGEDIDGSLSPTSNILDYTSTSGIKGFSYIIDSNPNTQVDEEMDIAEGREIDISFPDDNREHYLHIRAIDNMNNVGDVKHIKLEKAELTESHTDYSNQVNLNWNLGSLEGDYTYKVYRKQEGEPTFKEIVSEEDGLKLQSYTDTIDTSNITALKPSVEDSKLVDSNENIEFTVTKPQDNTTRFTYYIEAQNSTTGKTVTSNLININIKSKTVGYSYTIDTLESTDPDISTDIESSATKIKVPNIKGAEHKFFHIRAIDNFNNVSATTHYKVKAIAPPELILEASTTSPTKDNVVINVRTVSEAGIEHIILPNGQKIMNDSASYSVERNGRYSFIAVDNIGNKVYNSIEINNIDKTKPTLEILKDPNTEWSNVDVNVTINGQDS